MNGTTESSPASAVTDRTQKYLAETRPWVRFMSIIVFIGAGFMVIAALAMFAFMSAGGAAANNPLAGVVGGSGAALIYLALALLYVAPGVFLSRYASAIGRLAKDGSVSTLEDALQHQRSFWRYAGILTLVGLVLAVLVIILAIVAGVVAALAR
jgi:hypothetical protein